MINKTLTEAQVKQSVSFLNRSFRECVDDYKTRVGSYSNVKGTILYGYQTEYAYLVDNIQRGPRFFATQYIAEANELMGQLQNETRK